jgi:hypothetical protein
LLLFERGDVGVDRRGEEGADEDDASAARALNGSIFLLYMCSMSFQR